MLVSNYEKAKSMGRWYEHQQPTRTVVVLRKELQMPTARSRAWRCISVSSTGDMSSYFNRIAEAREINLFNILKA